MFLCSGFGDLAVFTDGDARIVSGSIETENAELKA